MLILDRPGFGRTHRSPQCLGLYERVLGLTQSYLVNEFANSGLNRTNRVKDKKKHFARLELDFLDILLARVAQEQKST